MTIPAIIAALAAAVVLTALAAWCGLRVGIRRGMTYASDRHAGYTEGLIDGHADGKAERDELIARLVRVRAEVAAINTEFNAGRPTVWSDSVPPGGRVCGVLIPGGDICGWPVESEPRPQHVHTSGGRS